MRQLIASTLEDLLYDAGLRAPVSEDRVDRAVRFVDGKVENYLTEWLNDFVDIEINAMVTTFVNIFKDDMKETNE